MNVNSQCVESIAVSSTVTRSAPEYDKDAETIDITVDSSSVFEDEYTELEATE